MIPAFTDNPLYRGWPFWVLDLGTSATAIEVEKSAREMNAKIKLGVKNSKYFSTPEGESERDEFLIREAKSKLLDPESRLKAEYWYIEPLKLEDNDKEKDLDARDWRLMLGVEFWLE